MANFKFCYKCKTNVEKGTKHYCSKDKKKVKDKEIHSYRWQKKREFIINLDGGYCQRCFVKYGDVNTSDLTVHHIKSREHYPELTYEDSNLVTVCMTCNNQLGTKDKLDFNWSREEYQPRIG